jgi:transposase
MAYGIDLSEKGMEELRERKRKERDGKILRRLMCIEMKYKGMKNNEIAEYCGVCIDTITDWLFLYKEGSFEGLCSLKYEGRRISKLEKYSVEIRKKIEEEDMPCLKGLKQWIFEAYGVETCVSNLFYFCKKNSIFPTRRQD